MRSISLVNKFCRFDLIHRVCISTTTCQMNADAKKEDKSSTSVKTSESSKSDELTDNLVKKVELYSPTASKYIQKMIVKVKGEDKEDEKEERKGPFKYYQDSEERDKKQIMFYEEYFDKICRNKDRDNFMNALDAFIQTNPRKNLYIDFIYGALLKMKEYNTHNYIEAYRKLMTLFPIGPLVAESLWQRDTMHFPRHQNCALQILEQMERNGVMPDEDFVRLTIQIFGDWTHVVRKAKRQLYWMPKFKNANPYPLPISEKLENMNDLDLALTALERMFFSVDTDIKVQVNYTKDIAGVSNQDSDQHTWIATAQGGKQVELLREHKRGVPIFVVGPHFTWVRSKMVEYYMMKTDPLEELNEKAKQLEAQDLDDVKDLPNMFGNPFDIENRKKKKAVQMTPFEMFDGIVYGLCCVGSKGDIKQNLFYWTKILEQRSPVLKDHLIVFRVKPKGNCLADMSKFEEQKNQ